LSGAAVPRVVARTVVATADPPPPGVPNPVHAAEGARAAGYEAPLVAGVRTYGWAVGPIVDAAGSPWLDDGWVDFRLCRPVFAGDTLTITVTAATSGWRFSVTSQSPAPQSSAPESLASQPDRVVLEGSAGMGTAPWVRELDPPPAAPGQDPPPLRPTYDLSTAPVGRPLRPLSAYVTAAAARAMVSDDLGGDTAPFSTGGRLRVHPYFLAARMAPLTRHNFTYGPTIHVRSQVQHCGPAWADQMLTVGARIVEVYERNAHAYQVLDGRVSGDGGHNLALIRHHTIFRPRGTEPPEPMRSGPG
jgi:acyl dehydratase